MRLSQIQKKYITEGWNDPEMLLLEQRVIDPFVSNVERIVLEAELTADQIKQVFANVEQGATAAGDNRTAVGKGADAVKNTAAQINQQIDKLGGAIKNAGPVQNIDAKFKELKAKIGEKDSKVVQAVKAVSDWAKENPGKASVAVAILTSAAALAAGPLGGLVGGFLARATKDVLQGKDLSTAVGKSIKTGAVGALAGGAIEVIGDLVDPDVAQTIIASDGQTIDVGALEGMKATSIENLSPEAAEDLLKTQNALETALKNVSGEEAEIIQAEFSEVSQKIGELGGSDALADHAGLEGQDLQRDTTSTLDTGTSSDVVTISADPISADQLKEVGINFDAEPDISPEVADWAESKGLDPEQVQKMFQMEKGMADAEFMGTPISGTDEIASSWSGDTPTLGTTTLPDGTEVTVGDKITSEISTSVGGIEPPINFTSSVTIEGVDADGNPVFVVEEVTTQPTHPLWDNLDKANLSDEDFNQLMQYMNEYTGVSMDSKAGVDVVVDTFKQDLAKSIGAAAVAVAMSVALQEKQVVAKGAEGEAPAKAQESIDYKVKRLSEGQIYMLFNRVERVNTHMLENKLMFESVFDAVSHYHRTETLVEFDKGGLSALGGALKKGAKAVGGAVAKGAKAAGGAIAGAAKQVTTKVTAEKLMTAWKKAGSPTDSAAVYDVIKGLGVADDVIKGTFDAMKIEVPAATDAPDGDQDPGAADAETNADAPTDSTAGDGGSDAASDTATDAPVDSDPTTPGVQEKDKQFIMVADPKDKTKFNVVDSKTQKVVDGGAGLDAGSAEEMRDEKNAEVVSQKQASSSSTQSSDNFDMDYGVPLNPEGAKKFQQTDPVERNKLIKTATDAGYTQNKDGTFNKPGETPKADTDGATDTDTASTSGGQGTDATTEPTDQVDANKDGLDDKTGNPIASNRGGGQGQDTAAPGGVAPVDVNALAAEIKKLKPEQIEDAKKLLAA
jgi:hypothetical protein